MPRGLERIIALMRRTHDRCIVVDETGSPLFVIVPLEAYEHLVFGLPPTAAGTAGTGTDPLLQQLDLRVATVAPNQARTTPVARAEAPAAGEVDLPLESQDPVDQYFFEPIE